MSGFFGFFRGAASYGLGSESRLEGFIHGLNDFVESGSNPLPYANRIVTPTIDFASGPSGFITKISLGDARNSHLFRSAKLAAMNSNIPTMPMQDARLGEFSIVTNPEAYGGNLEAASIGHALNSYISVMGMQDPNLATFLTEGSLRNKTQFNPIQNFLASEFRWQDSSQSMQDRNLFYSNQFLGTMDVYGHPSGGEFQGQRAHPERWGDTNLLRRLNPGINDLINSISIDDSASGIKAGFEKQMLRVKHSADSQYENIHDFATPNTIISRSQLSGTDFDRPVQTDADVEGRPDVTPTDIINRSGEGIASVLASTTGTTLDVYNSETGELLHTQSPSGTTRPSTEAPTEGNVPSSGEAASGNIYVFADGYIPDPDFADEEEYIRNRYGDEAANAFTEGRYASSVEDAERMSRAGGPESSEGVRPSGNPEVRHTDTHSIDNTPPSLQDTPTQRTGRPGPFSESGGFNVNYEDFDSAARAQYDERNVNVVDSPSSIDTSAIRIISEAEYDALEKRYPIGGIGHQEEGSHLVSTPDAVHAVNTLRDIQKSFGLANDSDRRFYENIGKNAIGERNFSVHSGELDTVTNKIKRKMMLGGAIVGRSEEGGHLWLMDEPLNSLWEVGSSMSNRPQDFPRPNFRTIQDTPIPEMDPNPDNWRIRNMDISMRDAMGKGYIMPIGGRDAVFLPSFANPDFSMGVEIESFLTRPISEITRGIQQNYGYNLNHMAFNGEFSSHNDPSVYGGGKEYITPVMSGLRAFKAGYLLGEQLKSLGDVPPIHRGPDRFDTSGLHVNIGTIPAYNKKNAFKFSTDMLRLQEDVIKRMSEPDVRYNYYSRPSTGGQYSPYNSTIKPERLPPDARSSPHEEHGRQFWSQSISKFRSAGRTNEYDYYRNNGKHYSNVALEMSMSDVGKLAKYKTFGMHKLQLMGLMEYRSPMYVPGGDHVLASMAMGTKLAADIFQASQNHGAFARTNKLIPPIGGWFNGDKNVFNNIAENFLNIRNPVNQEFMWQMHQKCGQVTMPPDANTLRSQGIY